MRHLDSLQGLDIKPVQHTATYELHDLSLETLLRIADQAVVRARRIVGSSRRLVERLNRELDETGQVD